MNTAAIFTSIEAAARTMNQTGRSWTPTKTKRGVTVRAAMNGGWRAVTEIDVFHINLLGTGRVIRKADGSMVAVS